MVLVKNWSFFRLLLLGNVGQENALSDFLEGKNVCLSYENKKLKKSKN